MHASLIGRGLVLVGIFIVGLLASNSLITLLSAFGFLRARQHTGTLMALGGLTAAFSLTVGMLFLLGQGSLLPAILGG
jgi:hypothetical protein